MIAVCGSLMARRAVYARVNVVDVSVCDRHSKPLRQASTHCMSQKHIRTVTRIELKQRRMNGGCRVGWGRHVFFSINCSNFNKKAQLSLTNPRDAKACQKLLQFDVLTTLLLTILVHLNSFSCCCVRNLRNPKKFSENSNLWSSRSSKVIDLGVSRKRICNFLLVINCNLGRTVYLLQFSRY